MDLFRTDENTSKNVMDESNSSMALQEAIYESLQIPFGVEESTSGNSPSPESDSTSYYPPVLPDMFDNFASSRVPSNVKELQSQLKSAQDDCFTLKLKLYFLEEDYKNKLGGEKLSKENVNVALKAELVRLKELLAKKDHLLQSALIVLQKTESTETLGKGEWAVERQEMEKRQRELEMVWQQRVAELEKRLGLASDSGDPASASSAHSHSSAATSGSGRTASVSKAESVSSIERDNNDQAVQSLKENLKCLKQQTKEMKQTHSAAMKGKDKELNTLHSALNEKEKQVQDLLLERNRLLEDTHQKIAELMSMCTTKDENIARLETLCRTPDIQNQDNNNNFNNNNINRDNQGRNNEGMTQLLSEIKVLKQELEQMNKEKTRVVEEAEIMDQQQQELSEQIERLNQELRTLRREKMEVAAQLAAAEKQGASCSCSSTSGGGASGKKSPKKQDEHAKTREERPKDHRKLLEEVKRLRKESADKERCLQSALEELKALKSKDRHPHEEEARTKLTTTESSKKPLYELKQRRPSSSTGGEQDVTDRQRNDIPSGVLEKKPRDSLDLLRNLSLLHSEPLMGQDLKTMTFEQMRDRLLHTEALCWSMQSHLEDMAELFQALLGNGDLKRFERTLTPKEVHKLKSLVDRTLHISVTFGNRTNASQDELLLELISSSVQESEPENQSRDRDLSVVSVSSHVRSFREFASGSETDSVAILSSGSSEEQSGRVRRSRLSSTTEHSHQLSPSLIQGLLEVLRRTERSSLKLCSQLETFGQSHLFKLLVEEILDKLKQENLLQGSTPGREWEEVAQELQSFQRKSQEVIQAATLAKRCLNDGLVHLSRTSLSVSGSSHQGQSAESLFVPVSTSGSRESTSGSWTPMPVDRAWAETLVDAHYHLAQVLEEQSHQLHTMFNQSGTNYSALGFGDWNQLAKDLLNLWPSRSPQKDATAWYKDGLGALPKTLPLLQQAVRSMFSVMTESLHDCESTIQESAKRLKTMEASQENRLKEIRQIQDWNLRLQMEQKSKESHLQLMKIKEVEQTKEIERLSSEPKQIKTGEGVLSELDAALLEIKGFKSKEVELTQKIKSQSWEIEKFTVELESEKSAVHELSSRLEAALMNLESMQEREKQISNMMHRTAQSKSDLEACVQSLKEDVERLTAEKLDLESNSRLLVDAATSNLSSQLNEALSKITGYESKEKKMKEQIRLKTEEIDKLAAELESKRPSQINKSSTTCQEFGDAEMLILMKDKNSEIDMLKLELESARESVQKLRSELDATLDKLKLVEGRERTISMMMEKTVQAKSLLETSAQALRQEVEKQTSEKYEAELKKSRYQLEVATTKLKNIEKLNTEMQQDMAKLQTKHNDDKSEWIKKIDHEQQEQLQLEKELEQTRKTIETQSKECSEAAVKVNRLNQEVAGALRKLESSETENKRRLAEVEKMKSKIKLLEAELLSLKQRAAETEQSGTTKKDFDSNVKEDQARSKADLEMGRKEIERLNAQCKKLEQRLCEISNQKEAVVSEPVPTSDEVSTVAHKLQQRLDEVEKQKDQHLRQVEVKWKEKILALEKDATRLREEVRESHKVNKELRMQICDYEERLSAQSQKGPHDVIHHHPSLLDSAEQVPTDLPSTVIRDETSRTNDLLGEMRELKREVVLNNHSSARLCRELQQHGHPCHRQQCPLGKSSSSGVSPLKKKSQQKAANRSQSSSPDSGKVEAQRRQLLEGINGGFSSGTGSAETLTLLTASSEASFSSYPATSNEDLRAGGYTLPNPSMSKRGPSSGHSPPGALPYSIPDPKSGSPHFTASDDRWKRRSSSPSHCSQSSSDGSLLHRRVRRQLGDEEKRLAKRVSSTQPNQDHAENDPTGPRFQYEGPLVVMLAQTSGPALGLGDGDGDTRELQRSHYSSPDLGIESDPNMVSCRSSSTSSTDSHPAARTTAQMKGLVVSGKGVRTEKQTQVENVGTQSIVHHDCAWEHVILEPITDTQSNIFVDAREDNLGMALHGLCPLRDLELLRQELEEALVNLQGTRATVQSRLSSKKISSPAKSLEYSTLKEVDFRCVQLCEYLLRCKKLLESFRTLPLPPAQPWPSMPQVCLQLDNQNRLSPISSSETLRLDISRRGLEESEKLKGQVLNLQNKLRNAEEQYHKALEIIKANRNKSKLVNRALEKQLTATTKVIMMAKGNLKQNTDVFTVQQSEATKNKCS